MKLLCIDLCQRGLSGEGVLPVPVLPVLKEFSSFHCTPGSILAGRCSCRGVLNFCTLQSPQSPALLPLRLFNPLFFPGCARPAGQDTVCHCSLEEGLKILAKSSGTMNEFCPINELTQISGFLPPPASPHLPSLFFFNSA